MFFRLVGHVRENMASVDTGVGTMFFSWHIIVFFIIIDFGTFPHILFCVCLVILLKALFPVV